MLKMIAFGLVFISIIFFLGTVYHLFEYIKSSIFPPKSIIRKRMQVLAGASGIFLIVSVLFFYLS